MYTEWIATATATLTLYVIITSFNFGERIKHQIDGKKWRWIIPFGFGVWWNVMAGVWFLMAKKKKIRQQKINLVDASEWNEKDRRKGETNQIKLRTRVKHRTLDSKEWMSGHSFYFQMNKLVKYVFQRTHLQQRQLLLLLITLVFFFIPRKKMRR